MLSCLVHCSYVILYYYLLVNTDVHDDECDERNDAVDDEVHVNEVYLRNKMSDFYLCG